MHPPPASKNQTASSTRTQSAALSPSTGGLVNCAAYLLANTNSISIKVAKYASTDKCDQTENEEYGYCSLIKATYRVLDKLEIENHTLAACRTFGIDAFSNVHVQQGHPKP